ncbi:uncharacterized protein BP5553_06378 [Venustampulla echinocandica]|uniref:P-loop containing nucleoside triphosphate hydrolase n=1 Tax=Venustampulla echinocandica TaxID=2656787 RepID=A0A370TJR9_9HELO|nr:uncharacterized protein BP5553_06378 [Venustampulla echinocandica]RDL35766.1 hypothetical protein BP5553_06378 [Venustampulla echinocandica]
MKGSFESYNIVVVGGAGVGKATFIHQFELNSFIEHIEPTACSEKVRKQVIVDDRACLIQSLDPISTTDAADREWAKKYWKQQVLEADAAILMYSVTSRETLMQVARLHSAILDVLAAASNLGGGHKYASILPQSPHRITIPICLVGNKIDQHAAREISYAEGVQLAKSLGCCFFEASAKREHTVRKVYDSLIRAIRRGDEVGQQCLGSGTGQDALREASAVDGGGVLGCFVRLYRFVKR